MRTKQRRARARRSRIVAAIRAIRAVQARGFPITFTADESRVFLSLSDQESTAFSRIARTLDGPPTPCSKPRSVTYVRSAMAGHRIDLSCSVRVWGVVYG